MVLPHLVARRLHLARRRSRRHRRRLLLLRRLPVEPLLLPRPPQDLQQLVPEAGVTKFEFQLNNFSSRGALKNPYNWENSPFLSTL